MPANDAFPLGGLLDLLRLSPEDEHIFARFDPAATLQKVEVIAAAAIFLNLYAVDEFGGRPGAIRARGLVEQVVGAAFQAYAGIDPHPGPFDKAAMLLRGITQGHPFNDGNKRTGFLVAALYLKLVGYRWPAQLAVEDVVAFCLDVSAGRVRDVDVIASTLHRWWEGS
jgi:death-on-curing protein